MIKTVIKSYVPKQKIKYQVNAFPSAAAYNKDDTPQNLKKI